MRAAILTNITVRSSLFAKSATNRAIQGKRHARSIKQLPRHFVGEVFGVDLGKPLTPQEAADIEAGMDRSAVLVFHGQDITDEQQMAFRTEFGEREESARAGNIVKPQDSRLSTGLNDVSNLEEDGKPLPPDSRVHLFNLANCLWHSDSSFRPIPAKRSSRC